LISFSGAFHGRTALTMAMTGKVAPYKQQFGPGPADIFHAPFPLARYGVDVETSLLVLAHILRADVGPERVAAIVLEPVQGEGGFHQAPPELMRALRTLCDQHGIMLIADEVQTGFARTGKLFAMEHFDVKADLITTAKSLAGGLPLSGVIGRAEIMDRVDPGGLGGTYGGSPLGCAAALAVLDVIEQEGLCERANALGARAKTKLEALARRNDIAAIDDIRGLGSMIAFDLVTERGGAAPDGAAAKRVTTRALENGLILLSCGVMGETIRLLYPLTIEDDLFDEGLARLEAALSVTG
jgi:4-aminobutyrate aminotransferase/(S)-3-amino-2-methylpropionate transaminase